MDDLIASRCPNCGYESNKTLEELNARHLRLQCQRCFKIYNAKENLVNLSDHKKLTAQKPLGYGKSPKLTATRNPDSSPKLTARRPKLGAINHRNLKVVDIDEESNGNSNRSLNESNPIGVSRREKRPSKIAPSSNLANKAEKPSIASSNKQEPSAAQPSAAQPSAAQPNAAHPNAAQPSAAQPSAEVRKAAAPKAMPKSSVPTSGESTAASPKIVAPKIAKPKAKPRTSSTTTVAPTSVTSTTAASAKAASQNTVSPDKVAPSAARPSAAHPNAARPSAAHPSAAHPSAAPPKPTNDSPPNQQNQVASYRLEPITNPNFNKRDLTLGDKASAALTMAHDIDEDFRMVLPYDDSFDDISLKEEYEAVPHTPIFGRWMIIIPLLIIALFQIEYLWRDKLSQFLTLRPMVQKWCSLMDCELTPLQSPSIVQIVDSRIQEKSGYELELRFTLLNTTRYQAALPVIEVQFSDIKQEIIANFHIEPEQYSPLIATMTPNEQMSYKVLIEVDNPSPVSSFEIRTVNPIEPNG